MNDKIKTYHYIPNKVFLKKIIIDFESNNSIEEINIQYEDLKYLFNEFKSHFTIIEAAGGVVFNSKNEIIIIKRLGKWDLPKGKIESGENQKDAAIREVEEECGIDKLEITNKLHTSFHTYILNGNRILKPTYWYKMRTSSNSQLVPQTEEDITEAKWINLIQIDIIKQNTYKSIIDVFQSL